jgi:hypothetical protein
MAKLTRYPRSSVDAGAFHATGSLEGMRTPRGPVYSLDWRRGASGLAALEPLTALTELDDLILEHASGISLDPLAKLPLQGLELRWISDTDLAPLASLPDLTGLTVIHPAGCRVPKRLRLSEKLRVLILMVDEPGATGADVKALIEAIDWTLLSSLRALKLHVGPTTSGGPIHVDLGFVGELPELTELDVGPGVHQAVGRPSPFEPPFERLPTRLEVLRIDAPDPESAEHRLREHIEGHVSVSARKPHTGGEAAWTPFRSGDGYVVYGSLADLAGGRFETEYEALEDAQRQVGAADAALLVRLDFDQESSGTGISAATREDLAAVLRILSAP